MNKNEMTSTPTEHCTEQRTETDLLGSVEIPAAMLYGINAVRGVDNLTVSARNIGAYEEFTKAFALCKWAAALANHDVGALTPAQRDAIAAACREIIAGQHRDALIVDLLEGSGGTSTNMNFNEVIANRSNQILGTALGSYAPVHPNDHVNGSQSTNDVYPAAMKIASHAMLAALITQLQELAAAFAAKEQEFDHILHLGRTCMQDAQPMRLGQVFGGYAALANRLASELETVRNKLTVLPLGGTAIGTGFGAPQGYRQALYTHLSALSQTGFSAPDNAFDAMQNIDVFARVSGELRTAAAALAKIASDLITLSSGPAGGIAELALPAVQAGSSIMPGKVNPVLPMAMIQLGFAVIGNDTCIAQATQAGQLEINHFEPVVADRLFESIHLLTAGIRQFREKCVNGITANAEVNERHLFDSMAVATALVPTLGYKKVSALARQSVSEGRPLIEILDESGLLSRAEARTRIELAARAQF